MVMSKIFWDTNPFVYLFEKHPDYWKQVKELREKMTRRGDQLVTSSMTLGEIQVKARRMGRYEDADRYRNAVIQVASIVGFDVKAADAYAMIREKTNIRGADAIQLACASAVGVEVFITNDKQLHNLSIPNVHFIVPLDRIPF
jgi:predicted nucleic acid-binding protein